MNNLSKEDFEDNVIYFTTANTLSFFKKTIKGMGWDSIKEINLNNLNVFKLTLETI